MYMHNQHQPYDPLHQQQFSDQQNGSLIDIYNAFHFAQDNSKHKNEDIARNSIRKGSEEGQNEAEKTSPWRRMNWTDAMVKLLITAVSYAGDDFASEGNENGAKRKQMLSQRKGKWKAISQVMKEKGFYVSPQQCEDKFNDLNKRYKRLTDILGKGTSCRIVENPVLLDHLIHLTEKKREIARKILSSKHLFYEEMCSYHNRNRPNLPHDVELQRMVHLALNRKNELIADSDEEDELSKSCFAKRIRTGIDGDRSMISDSPLHSQVCKGTEGLSVDIRRLLDETESSFSRQIEKKRLIIDAKVRELEEKRIKWRVVNEKENRELERVRLENERMRIDNERMSVMLRQRELELDLKQ